MQKMGEYKAKRLTNGERNNFRFYIDANEILKAHLPISYLVFDADWSSLAGF